MTRLRGALALALALGLPAGLPQGKRLITTAFVIVAFSIFAQGLTMPPLLRKLGANLRGLFMGLANDHRAFNGRVLRPMRGFKLQ